MPATTEPMKIRYTHAEQAMLLTEAVRLIRADPAMKPVKAVNAAMTILPEGRRKRYRNFYPTTHRWVLDGIAERLAVPAPEPEPESRRGVDDTAEKAVPVQARRTIASVDALDFRRFPVEAPREVEAEPAPESTEQLAFRLVGRVLGERDGLLAEVAALRAEVQSMRGYLRGAFAALGARYEPELAIRPVVPVTPRPVPKIRIGVVGPRLDVFTHAESKVNGHAKMVFLDVTRAASEVPDLDWCITTKHASHSWDTKVRQKLGRDRLVHISTSGVDTIVKTVFDLASRQPAPVR